MDVVAGRAEMQDTIVRMKDTELYLLLERKGMRSNTEIAGSQGMAELMEEARKYFDYVIVDTPPMSVASDAEFIMELADASLLVVRQNYVTSEGLNRAAAALDNARSKLLGCVVNNVYSLPQGEGYGYGYGYGHYGRYGKYGKYSEQ